MENKCYFQMVEHPQGAAEFGRSAYLTPDRQALSRFNSANGFRGNEFLNPGHLVMIPGLDGGTEASRGAMSRIGERANHSIRNASTPVAARRFNDDFELFEMLSGAKDEMKVSSKVLSGGSKFAGAWLGEVTRNLKGLEGAYQQALARRVKLSSPEFARMKLPFEQALKAGMPQLTRKAILRHADGRSMKDSLGISHKSLAHSFRTSGAPVEIKGISDALGKTSKFAGMAKHAGTVGRVLSVGSSVGIAAEDFRRKGAATGFNTMGREAAGLAGGLAAGTWGATAGAAAAVLVFGAGTGGAGFVVIGIGAMVGGLGAGAVGSAAAKGLYEGAHFTLDNAAEAAIEWWFR